MTPVKQHRAGLDGLRHEARTNFQILESWYDPFLERLVTSCLYSCYVSNSKHENGHVLEQYDTGIDVCRKDANLAGSLIKE